VRIHINKDSDVPVSEQLAAQLVYLIGSGQIGAGEALPSVRSLALRLNLHRNTVSEAFHDSTLAVLVEKARGKRCRVREDQGQPAASEIDGLIDATLRAARKAGYTQRQVHDRLRDRLATAPPDHLLIVSEDTGLRVLMALELRRRFHCPVDGCSPDVPSQES
jgi:DNA-binding transcriptional regulator YhcF (GntR family)